MSPKRVAFTLTLALSLLAAPLAADVQQEGKVHRIGVLIPTSPSAGARYLKAFQQGLHERGYIERKNIIIESRYTEGRIDPLPELGADLVRLKVGVIVTRGQQATRVAQKASGTIPIVFAGLGSDPVEIGLISSMARPGGNVTGLTSLAPELNGKRLELLKEVFPKVARVAFLWRIGSFSGERHFKEAEAVAGELGMRLHSVGVREPDDLERGLEAARRAGAQALTSTPSPLFTTHRVRIATLATKNRLPAIYPSTEFVEAGGLMSYGPDDLEYWRRAATYVDKILKGAKPGDLPVEQPTKFELVINLKTAKALGLKIPQSILVRADEVIQ